MTKNGTTSFAFLRYSFCIASQNNFFECNILLFLLIASTVSQKSSRGVSGGRTDQSVQLPPEFQEAAPLKERMALYQAAVSKVEISNSSANVSGCKWSIFSIKLVF